MQENKLALYLNLLDLLGIVLISVAAIGMQFILKELPCPLCLLQRLGLLAIGFGYLLNVKFGFKTFHYAISTIAALLTSYISMRQILLHIVPGTGYYGDAILGLHMYTWLFILCNLTILCNMLVMCLGEQFKESENIDIILTGIIQKLSVIVSIIFLIIIILNLILLIFQCGLMQCPDNPTTYLLFRR